MSDPILALEPVVRDVRATLLLLGLRHGFEVIAHQLIEKTVLQLAPLASEIL